MDHDERTYSKSEIREQRREAEKRLPLEQRRLAALAKIDEAHEELEQVERELEALDRERTSPEQPADAEELEQVERELETLDRERTSPEQPAEADSPEPTTIGERMLKIMKEHADIWLEPRNVLAELDKRGWMDTDPGHGIQRVRHSLRRLANSNPHVERDESGPTFRYRYVSRPDTDAPVPIARINGVPHSALQGGRR